MTTTPTPSEMTWRDFLLSKGAQFKVLATGKVGTFQGFLVRKIERLPVNIIVDGEYYLENQVELLDSKKLKDEYHGVSTPSDAREELRDKVANLLADDYACTRVWEAWQVGTMTQDDFEPLSETERADEIVALFDTLLAKKVREALQSILESETLQFPSQAAARAVIEAHLKGASK